MWVAVEVGVQRHRVAIGVPGQALACEFDIDHSPEGFAAFFRQVEAHTQGGAVPVAVAMEGYNGHARPLDGQVLARGWRLFNVNNLKLARYKEIFPGPAKSDPIDSRKMLGTGKGSCRRWRWCRRPTPSSSASPAAGGCW